MFGLPKDNFFTKKARINFEVYGQNYPMTPEAEEKRLLFIVHSQPRWGPGVPHSKPQGPKY